MRTGPNGPFAIVQLPSGLAAVLVKDAVPAGRGHTITDTDLKTDRTNFARLLRELRQRAKLTQFELGEKIGLTQYAVAGWENGRCFPRTKNLVEIATVLGVTVDELLGRLS